MIHPHPDPHHIVRQYRRHIMRTKERFGSARSLVHYRQLVACYLSSKRIVLQQQAHGTASAVETTKHP